MEVHKKNLLFDNNNDSLSENKGKDIIEKYNNTLTEELFIGLCAPIGTYKEEVINEIKNIITTKYGYQFEKIKLSDFIKEHYKDEIKKYESNYDEYIDLIERGNRIRKEEYNTFLSEKAISYIHQDRIEELEVENPKPTDFVSRRKLFLIDSFKSKEELDIFRKIYNENFFQISLFTPNDDRKTNLKHNKNFEATEVEKIIAIDDKQSEKKHGQNVRDTFVDGDFYIRVSNSNKGEITRKIERFFHLIFESSVITPTIEERAMYAAKSASGNSACLSRQVGASIVDENGILISTGWNDVPKYGGNLYSEGNFPDNRCFNGNKYCTNDKKKNDLVDDIIKILTKDEEINSIFKEEDTLNTELINKIKHKIRGNSRVKDLIEFSRSVHAEMHAILQGGQLTNGKLINGKLFCTTYPCHNCARHIIASGIKEVYYIEPYVKSLCIELHKDSMTENEAEAEKVKVLMFDGIAPRSFLHFFNNLSERKLKNGDLSSSSMDLRKLKPKRAKSIQALPTLEGQAIFSLHENSNNINKL